LLELGALASCVWAWFGQRRRAEWIFVSWAAFICSLVTLDTRVYTAFGRHALEFARLAFLPGAAQIAGGSAHWLELVMCWAALGAAATFVCNRLARELMRRAARSLSVEFRRALGVLFTIVLLAALALPHFVQSYYREPALREGLRASLLWPPTPFASEFEGPRDSRWGMLASGLKQAYARSFPLVFSEHRPTIVARNNGPRPSVLLLVLESLRQDSLTAERMPRLYAWAQRGLVAKRHFAGSTFSEAGMFSLLYGRSPLLYHATLDRHEPPTWCSLAHALGMDCAYYSGQPKEWMRLEEFLNPRVVDHFEHDDRGDWNEWDRRAVHGAVDAIRGGARPSFVTVYLMSTHFEYQYPAEYARHMPVMTDVKWPQTNMLGIDISNRVPMTNRYLNSLAFSDDLLADAIAQLDPERTIIVLTGDHGESLGDDGRFGHAYSFADAISTVPFAIVGPGVPRTTLDSPTLHADVLRTLAHALGGELEGPYGAQDLLAPEHARAGLLLAHCSFDHDMADTLLIHGDRRVRIELGLHVPSVKIRGPENTRGQPSDTNTLSAEQARGLLDTFTNSLDGMWQRTPSMLGE
jgi:membrane-anchored protein YejM (alkaline phosphatase superfamily)